MKDSTTNSDSDVFTEQERRDSGLPLKGELGEAKKEAWGLAAAVLILLLILAAAFLDYAP